MHSFVFKLRLAAEVKDVPTRSPEGMLSKLKTYLHDGARKHFEKI